MWKCRRRWLLLIALVGFSLTVYFEPTHCVRGWLWGEAFFDGRPTSYWAEEIAEWECYLAFGRSTGTLRFYDRRERTILPPFLQKLLPKREAQWPKLLDGDPEGVPVLNELRHHRSEDIREWARIGIKRVGNDQRGPVKWVSFLTLDVEVQ